MFLSDCDKYETLTEQCLPSSTKTMVGSLETLKLVILPLKVEWGPSFPSFSGSQGGKNEEASCVKLRARWPLEPSNSHVSSPSLAPFSRVHWLIDLFWTGSILDIKN